MATIRPRAERITTDRLELCPLRPADADDLFVALNDERLHRFTGGRPLPLAALRERYRLLARGRSPDAREAWLNWTVRLRSEGTAIGTVQATVAGAATEVAWVIGLAWQGQGFAAEAARALVAWLAAQGVTAICAKIPPDHAASQGVARRAGLSPTAAVVDGEVVWRNQRAD